MNKKTGLILMFVGAYVILLGGLFWNMSAPIHNDYDWFWGLSAGVVVACGAALTLRKDFLAYPGFALVALGVAYSIVIVVVGKVEEDYFSAWMVIGAAIAVIGLIFGIIFHIRDLVRTRKYGPTLL